MLTLFQGQKAISHWVLGVDRIALLCVVAVCVLCLFFTVLWVGLWSVIVAFPGHTHLGFLSDTRNIGTLLGPIVSWCYRVFGPSLFLTLCIRETPKQLLLQTVKTQVKCSIMLHFISVYTVCMVKKIFRQKNTIIFC